MKILQINCVYKEGSTGKIVFDLATSLREQGHEVITCYGNGQQSVDTFTKKVCTKIEHKLNALWGRVTGIPYGGKYLSNHRVKKTIQEFKPDIVHVHCVNGYMINVYKLMKFLAMSHVKTVLTLHAEIFHTAGCGHAYDCEKWKIQCEECDSYKQSVGSWFFERSKSSWKRMYSAINSFDEKEFIITAVSPWLAERARISTIMKHYRIECVPNGLNTSIFYPRGKNGLIDKGRFEGVILFVTPYFSTEMNDIKGGRYIPFIAEKMPHYKFVIIASRTSSQLKPLPPNVVQWGRAESQDELARLYSEADVTLLLSRRETFSMVTAESQCCGTPVAGFCAGGPESIAVREFSFFVDYGNVDLLVNAIQLAIMQNRYNKDLSKLAKLKFDSYQMASLYANVYRRLLN